MCCGNKNERILQKIIFFNTNKKLCQEAFKGGVHVLYARKQWLTPSGRKLVNKAKCEIGYCCCTAPADVFITLRNNYFEWKDRKIIL
jgi:hypothetical protein